MHNEKNEGEKGSGIKHFISRTYCELIHVCACVVFWNLCILGPIKTLRGEREPLSTLSNPSFNPPWSIPPFRIPPYVFLCCVLM